MGFIDGKGVHLIPSRVIAACFGLISFAAAAVVGIAVDNPATTILGWALVTMIVGWLVGLVIGTITQRTVDDHIAQYKREHPIPGENGSPEMMDEETAFGKAA